jgi:hypothetical protein
MTRNESKKLKIGDRVVFSDGVRGEVTDTGYNVVGITWADGQCGYIHHDDMQDVARAFPFCIDPKLSAANGGRCPRDPVCGN